MGHGRPSSRRQQRVFTELAPFLYHCNPDYTEILARLAGIVLDAAVELNISSNDEAIRLSGLLLLLASLFLILFTTLLK